MSKKYTAKTLAGATRRVRDCEKVIAKYEVICRKLKSDRDLMALLASDEPGIFNPNMVLEAKTIRNEILNKHR